MNALLVLSSYLSPLVYRFNFAGGMSVFLLYAVGWPSLGAVVLLVTCLHIPTHPLFWLALAGLAFWFAAYAKRFAQIHKAAVIARSYARSWPRMRAVAILILVFLLFGALLKTARWI
uniref:hypothetical protein n=1 Tax=Hymenobacter sp. B1770 TaxID=1718788 RepID=UPI003CEE10FD